eukprot:5258676-Pyramimonas_sp.AAC.1
MSHPAERGYHCVTIVSHLAEERQRERVVGALGVVVRHCEEARVGASGAAGDVFELHLILRLRAPLVAIHHDPLACRADATNQARLANTLGEKTKTRKSSFQFKMTRSGT